jgi:UDP-N-acetylglucosamine 2-epimerase (non-hydrolysing)
LALSNNSFRIKDSDLKNKKVIVFFFGTRPEVIKIFVLYRILKKSAEFFPVFYNTAQQKISGDVLEKLGIENDITAEEIPNRSTDLNELIAHLLNDFNQKFNSSSQIPKSKVAGIFVQGDTASAYAGALWGFLNQIPVFHIEAGLRTNDRLNPFPEEFMRESIARAAALHFAPKSLNRDNLVSEGLKKDNIVVVGNTINDAIFTLIKEGRIKEPGQKNYILSTFHRRENWGNVKAYAEILCRLAEENVGYSFIQHILHPNPLIKNSFNEVLNGRTYDNLKFMSPIHDYFEMLGWIKNSGCILTDSGGLQEESLFFNVPCGVLRKTTERPEVLKKNARLLPFDADEILGFVKDTFGFRETHQSKYNYTYGFGDTSYLIYETLKKYYHFESTFTI